jgi:WD40 repeat protein
VLIWDSLSGAHRKTIDPQGPERRSPIRALAWHPAGQLLAISLYSDSLHYNNRVAVWDVSAARLVGPEAGLTVRVRPDRVDYPQSTGSLAFSPDGRRLAAVGPHYPFVALWDVPSAEPIRSEGWSLGMPGPVTSLVFASDSRHLLTGNGNGTVYVLRLD